MYSWRTRFLCLTALALAPLVARPDPPPPSTTGPTPRKVGTTNGAGGEVPTPADAQSKDPWVKVSGLSGKKITLKKGELSEQFVLEWKGDDFKFYCPSFVRLVANRNDAEHKVHLNLFGHQDGRGELLAVSAATVEGGKAKVSEILRITIVVGEGTEPETKKDNKEEKKVFTADKLLVFIVFESSKPFKNQVDVIEAVTEWAAKNGHWRGFIDQNVINSKKGVPKHLADPFRQAEGKDLPQVVIYANEGQTGRFLDIKPLPTDPAEAVKLLSTYEKKR